MSGPSDDDGPGEEPGDDEPDEPWRAGSDEEEGAAEEPDDPGHGGEDGDAPDGAGDFPSFSYDVPAPRLGMRSVLRVVFATAVLAAGCAVWLLDRGYAAGAEIAGLLALVLGALALPILAILRRLERYPARGTFRLDRRGFKLPWLGPEAPGPEGPWEALHGFRVRDGKATGKVLILETAAGRFALSDRLLGQEAFVAALSVLERALGPEGVLLGTVVRLPIHPHDGRSLRDRLRPRLVALGLAAAFLTLATVATGVFVKVAAGIMAFLCVVSGQAARAWNQPPVAELVLALDGLVVPIPDDLRRTIKLPFDSLRRGAVEEGAQGRIVLVIEHARGKLVYPFDWFDAREAREFARQLADRAR